MSNEELVTNNRLANQVVVVTGANRGIGAAIARRLLREGCEVVVASRGGVEADSTATAAWFVSCDVTVEEDVARLMEAVNARYGRIDALVNNAGSVGPVGSIAELDMHEAQKAWDVLVNGPLIGAKHAAKMMIPAGNGSIINISSIAGVRPGIGPHIYSIAKAALLQVTRTLSAELGPIGIRVNSISPGYVPTNFTKENELDLAKRFNDRYKPIQHRKVATQADEIAGAVVWLLSPEAAPIAAHNLVLDGGHLSGPTNMFATGLQREGEQG